MMSGAGAGPTLSADCVYTLPLSAQVPVKSGWQSTSMSSGRHFYSSTACRQVWTSVIGGGSAGGGGGKGMEDALRWLNCPKSMIYQPPTSEFAFIVVVVYIIFLALIMAS